MSSSPKPGHNWNWLPVENHVLGGSNGKKPQLQLYTVMWHVMCQQLFCLLVATVMHQLIDEQRLSCYVYECNMSACLFSSRNLSILQHDLGCLISTHINECGRCDWKPLDAYLFVPSLCCVLVCVCVWVSVYVCVWREPTSQALWLSIWIISVSSAVSLWTPGEVAALGHSGTGALPEPHPQLHPGLHCGRGGLWHYKSVCPYDICTFHNPQWALFHLLGFICNHT